MVFTEALLIQEHYLRGEVIQKLLLLHSHRLLSQIAFMHLGFALSAFEQHNLTLHTNERKESSLFIFQMAKCAREEKRQKIVGVRLKDRTKKEFDDTGDMLTERREAGRPVLIIMTFDY